VRRSYYSRFSPDIAPSYILPLQYDGLTCQQIALEAQRVSARVGSRRGQDAKRTNEAVATTVGVVLFLPPLFFIEGDNAIRFGTAGK
jgi:hypothetical protein